MSGEHSNADQAEMAKFDAMAAQWWDPDGECRPLHDINPARLDWISQRVELNQARVLDVGCGGGLLAEGLAQRGAQVTGIDLAKRALQVASMHAEAQGLAIDYRLTSAEALVDQAPAHFDAVCCLEALEHVPNPQSMVQACFDLACPGGSVFFSTINRHPVAWAGAIVGAERVLGLLPKGTHRYERLIQPAELAQMARQAGGVVDEITGLSYNPFSRTVKMGTRPWINYFVHATKPL